MGFDCRADRIARREEKFRSSRQRCEGGRWGGHTPSLTPSCHSPSHPRYELCLPSSSLRTRPPPHLQPQVLSPSCPSIPYLSPWLPVSLLLTFPPGPRRAHRISPGPRPLLPKSMSHSGYRPPPSPFHFPTLPPSWAPISFFPSALRLLPGPYPVSFRTWPPSLGTFSGFLLQSTPLPITLSHPTLFSLDPPSILLQPRGPGPSLRGIS